MATLHRLDPTRVELEVAIPDDELEKARDKAYQTLVRNTRIPGFRPGKAPRRVFEQQFGSQAIEEKALEEVFPRVYLQALEEHELAPLERPSIDWLPREPSVPGLRFKATVSIRPQFELVDYTAMKLDVPIPQATIAEIDESIDRLRRESATLVPVDRPAKLGDVVVVDYTGTIDGELFDGGSATGQQVELLEKQFIPGFAAGIAGLTPGAEGVVEAQFPDDYARTELAGKTAKFQVRLLEVKERELLPLDEEFVKKFLPQDPSVEALRAEVAKRIEAANAVRIKNEQAEVFIEQLLALHDIPLPELLVDRELEASLRARQLEVVRKNMSWPDYLQEQGKDEASLRAEFADEAKRRVKVMLIVEEVARREKISATARDIDLELEDLARQYGQSKQRVREAIGDELHSLADGIVRSKALDRMLDIALGLANP